MGKRRILYSAKFDRAVKGRGQRSGETQNADYAGRGKFTNLPWMISRVTGNSMNLLPKLLDKYREVLRVGKSSELNSLHLFHLWEDVPAARSPDEYHQGCK